MPGQEEIALALAEYVGKILAQAALTDAWGFVRERLAKLWGRGSDRKAETAGKWLDQTHQELEAASDGTGLEQAQAAAAERWFGRFADLLDENPELEVDLRALADAIAARLPEGGIKPTLHQRVTAGRDAFVTVGDVNISASDGGMAVRAEGGSTAIGKLELQPQPETPGQPVRLAPRPSFLTGREELLADLHARMVVGPEPRTVALCGLGGAGKTSAALEYAHRHLAEVSVCWQFPAEDPAALEAEFAALAAELGVRDLADARDPVASVHAVLARQEAGWLLLFDNAPDLASLERFLPPAGPGRVLITTQSQQWPPEQSLQVPVLSIEAAAGFLVSRTRSASRAAALELADALGGLPLALAQAAAYMQVADMSVDQYLPLFRARQSSLLTRGEATGHPLSVAATLGLALSELAARAPAALGLIRLMAYLAPEPVPIGVLLGEDQAAGQSDAVIPDLFGPLLGDPIEAADAIAALRRYSLVTPAGDGTVLVHRMVQAVTRASLPGEAADQWEQAAAAVVETAINAVLEVPTAYSACALLLPHARTALEMTSESMSRLAEYLTTTGSWPAARALWQQITDAYGEDGTYGPEHPSTLRARSNLIYLTGQAGDYAAARDQYMDLIPAIERVQGPEHPDALNARNYLAIFTVSVGDLDGARDQCADLLPIMERVLGPEHPDTLRVHSNLVQFTGETGDHIRAYDQSAKLLPVLESALGPEHPDALWARSNHAVYAGGTGNPGSARDQCADLLPIMERVLGPDHFAVLRTRNNLAVAIADAGDFGSARDQCAALLPDYERVFGAEHPLTLVIRDNLAVLTGVTGNPGSARDQCATLFPIMERVLGPDHIDTRIAHDNLGAWAGDDNVPRRFRPAYLNYVHAHMTR